MRQNICSVGSVALREDYVKSRRTVTLTATMTATTVTVDGVERTETSLVMGEVIGYRVKPILEEARREP